MISKEASMETKAAKLAAPAKQRAPKKKMSKERRIRYLKDNLIVF